LDATTLGALLVGLGAVGAAVAPYLGKRAENQNNRLNTAFDQIQEERDGLRQQLAERDTRIAELLTRQVADQVEIARLRVRIIHLGGDP
jgi:uncharacterized membrane-anchored protein YhcB (DUF1043 family)